VDSLRVGFESDSSSLGLPYNEGAPYIVTYDDLIAAGVQGKPAACVVLLLLCLCQILCPS
jgi:hypothetical protein